MKTSYYPIDYINNLPPFSGIYWLFELRYGILNLIYLGKSRNIRQRLKEHSQSKSHKFNFFAYEFYPERMLEKIEKEMLSDHIQRFDHLPRYNKQLG